MESKSFNAKLALKIRKIAEKVTCLLRNKKSKRQQKAEPMTPVNRQWTHPSEMQSSDYVDCCQFEADENALNEALEAKLRQLIVTEYASRRVPTSAVSLRIQGHLTITPTQQHQGTFWTSSSSSADADICWRDCVVSHQQQKAERQTPLLF